MEEILHQAEQLEKEYEWLRAAESYEKALKLLSEDDFSRKAETQERLGYAFYRAAFQAESNDEFRQRLRQATADYEKAKEIYQKLNDPNKTGIVFRCDAMNACMGYWLASGAPEKKRLLDECWQRTKKALDAFKETGDALEYGRTYNQLSRTAFLRYVLEWDFKAGEKIIEGTMELGEQAVALLSSMGDPHELAEAFVRTAFYLITFSLYFVPDLDERERLRQKGQGYLRKGWELSEEATLLTLASTPGVTGDETGLMIDEMQEHFEKALRYAKKTKDKYLVGTALDWLTYATGWKSMVIDDPDERHELFQRTLQYAEDTEHQFSSISFVSPRGDVFWTGDPYPQYYYARSFLFETDPRIRRDLLGKALMDSTRAIKLAESAGYPGIIGHTNRIFSLALGSLAQIETSPEEKERLLEKAMEYGTRDEKINEELYPFHYWNRGIRMFSFGVLKTELSNLEKNSETKKNKLEEAISDKKRALELCIKESSHSERRGDLSLSGILGLYWCSYGEDLGRLYRLTSNHEYERMAIRAFEDAAESYQKLNLVSRMAECYWKIATGYDVLGEFLDAAKNFNIASNDYQSAMEKIPQLKEFYQDHALYMQAWSEIEKARYHHERQEYGLARGHFEKTADLHKSLKQWSYLAPNYSAWANVERAEDFSRKEQCEEAIQALEQATRLFEESKKSIQDELTKIEDANEKQMATQMGDATDPRREYCKARIAIEEAKILDKKGDHFASSEKYCSAAAILQKIAQAAQSEQDRRECGLISTLSLAWARMTRAEAEGSPDLYLEASKLFEEAKELSFNEKAKMLALGHSRFCRALEAGTKFADTRDKTLHTTAVHHLESAATYYAKAGFPNASEYAKATELLFDAYAQMDNAKEEENPEKKVRIYAMAEKLLQTSAGAYIKAEHPEKGQQVQILLENVKEERELAISLTEVLHASTIVSTTAAFTTPAPTHEEAVGLERFEHADMQANIITRQKELKVGEDLDLEIELVNAGKGPALLIKVTEIIPEGFDLAQKPEAYRVEDSYINMKGKRLDPLKTEDVKLVLKPKVQGVFPLKPKILYLDENGKYKSHEPEPVTITVKELGIKGWLKGER
jgi:GNAT superfamily N-acetyltransferase